MSEKQKKPIMTQEENDRMMNRLMLAFVAAVCAVTAVMSVKNRCNTIVLYETAAPVMAGIAVILFVLCLVFFIVRHKSGVDDRMRVITKYNILGVGITALLCGAVYAVNPGIASVYSVVIIIGACALYFIRYIYSVSFLALAGFCLCEGLLIHAGFGLATVRAFSMVLGLLFRIAAVVLPIAFVVGMRMFRSKKPACFASAKMTALYVCAAVALLGSLILWLDAFGILYVSYLYILYVLGAAFLASGIIETVKSI